jgi:hypothetical protein
MEHSEVVESWANFFEYLYSTISEAQFNRSTESASVTESVLLKLECCIEGIARFKERIIRRSSEINSDLDEFDEENISVLHTAFDTLTYYLNKEIALWRVKLNTLSDLPSSDNQTVQFIHYSLSGLPGRPTICIDIEELCSLRAIGLSWVDISE